MLWDTGDGFLQPRTKALGVSISQQLSYYPSPAGTPRGQHPGSPSHCCTQSRGGFSHLPHVPDPKASGGNQPVQKPVILSQRPMCWTLGRPAGPPHPCRAHGCSPWGGAGVMGVPAGCGSPGAGDTEHRGRGVLGTQGMFRGLGDMAAQDPSTRISVQVRVPGRWRRATSRGRGRGRLPVSHGAASRPSPRRLIKRRRPVPEPRTLRM